jgi:peptide/nickel transport system substrate-binding protein
MREATTRWTVLRRFAISITLVLVVNCGWARTRPHYGGTLRAETAGDPWQRPDGVARRLVLDGLTRIDEHGDPQPALGIDWKADGDFHRWQFRLRPGVLFTDGSPLTSIAVAGSLNVACPQNCPWSAVRAVGASVVFTGESPMPNLPELLASDEFLIALTVTSEGKTPEGVIGTGAFQVSGFANGALTLAANENCWAGRPFLDSVEIRVHRPVREQWLDLSVGRADLVEVPAEQLRQAQQQRLTVLSAPAVSLLALQVTETGALANPMLRQAIALAVDRTALENVIFQKQGEVTASLLPASLTGYAFLFPTERNLSKAQELRGGLTAPPLAMATDGDETMQLAAQRIALNLHEAGFKVQVANGGAQRADLALRRIALESSEPQAALEAILRAAGTAAPGIEATPEALYQAEREALDRRILIPLLYLPRSFAVSGRVRDLRLSVNGAPEAADASLVDASGPGSAQGAAP